MRTSKMSKHRKNLALLMIAIMGFAQMNGILCVGAYAGQAEPLPAKYDMRELGLVTSAKAQGKINGCWAFASLGSLESNVRKLEKKDFDFSENNMLSQHGFDIGAADGGNMYMATAYLANWKGAILEKNDPYSRNSVVESRGTFPSDYKVQDVLFLEPRKNFKDNETIKNAIVTYGGVYSNLKWDDAGYHAAKNSYFNNSLKGYDHTVTIVGWDDHYAKENFGKSETYGDGAFICKNSWGTDWGESGYFYVSYYDFSIGKSENAVFLANGNQTYEKNYQYDELGCTDQFGYGKNEAWFANVFQATGTESVKAISFYTLSENTKYEIWLQETEGSDLNLKKAKCVAKGTLSNKGYHTVKVEPFALVANKKFAAMVHLESTNMIDSVAIESPKGSFSSRAKALEGQSFVSDDGSSWKDLTGIIPDANVCLKAFTDNISVAAVNGIQVTPTHSNTLESGKEAYVVAHIKNVDVKEKNVCLGVQLLDETKAERGQNSVTTSLKPGEEVTLKATLVVPKEGTYVMQGLVYDRENPKMSYLNMPITIKQETGSVVKPPNKPDVPVVPPVNPEKPTEPVTPVQPPEKPTVPVSKPDREDRGTVVNNDNGTVAKTETKVATSTSKDLLTLVNDNTDLKLTSKMVSVTVPHESLRSMGEGVVKTAQSQMRVYLQTLLEEREKKLVASIAQKNSKFSAVAVNAIEIKTEFVNAESKNTGAKDEGNVFVEPATVEYDLSQLKLSVQEMKQLTGVQYLEQANGQISIVKMGGSYDAQSNKFRFTTDKTGVYGLVKANELVQIEVHVNNKAYTCNGKNLVFDQAPLIRNDRTYVPVAAITEALGGTAVWNGALKSVTLTIDGKLVTYKFSEEGKAADNQAMIINGRTYVPLSNLAQTLDAHVLWTPSSKSVLVVK